MSLNNFLFNSDFPIDMITYFEELSVDFAANQRDVTISHKDLGYTPLLLGVASTKSDFSDSRSIGDSGMGYTLESYRDHINIHRPTSTARREYFRFYGFAPSTYNGTSVTTVTDSKPLILSTDYGYSPLLFTGAFTMPRYGVVKEGLIDVSLESKTLNGEYSKVTIVHNLGYMPTVWMWLEDDYIQPSYLPLLTTAGGLRQEVFPNVTMDENKVIINVGAWNQPSTVHVRIYSDGKPNSIH